MIQRAITSKDTNSRFYLHNERLATDWEVFAKKYQGKINGIVNGMILEFNLEFYINRKKIKVYQRRQQSNHNAGIVTNYSVAKNLSVDISSMELEVSDWKIRKKQKLHDFFSKYIMNCKPLLFDKHYTILSKTQINENDIIDARLWSVIRDFAELRYYKHKNETLSLEYFSFTAPKTLENLIAELFKKYTPN